MLAGKDGAYEPIGPDYYRSGMVGADGIGKEDGGLLGTRRRRNSGRNTTRNLGNEAWTKRKNDIKRRVGCVNNKGWLPTESN